MAKVERMRDSLAYESPSEVIERRTAAGWRMSAIEWERDVEDGEAADERLEPPFGLRVAGDCRHLEVDAAEHEVLTLVAQMIVHERRLPDIAEALNQRGHRTREGRRWGPAAVFDLMPRIIESSPGIFSSPSWPARRMETHI
jgi:hypothetical protein